MPLLVILHMHKSARAFCLTEARCRAQNANVALYSSEHKNERIVPEVIMTFKTTENLKNHAVYFYINSRRVTEDTFTFKRATSILSGMKEGAIITWTEKNMRYISFCIN